MLGPEFLHGIASLERYGLVYDILIFSHQLPAAAEMVRRFPDQVFVLDHIAKPSIRDGRTMPWASDIKGLAALPNVSCKMSGMVTEARWQDWTVEDFTPYMETVLEAFGPDRLLIGSDWPVCTLAGDYRSVMSIAADFVSRLSASEQKAIWEDNPVRVYGLRLGLRKEACLMVLEVSMTLGSRRIDRVKHCNLLCCQPCPNSSCR